MNFNGPVLSKTLLFTGILLLLLQLLLLLLLIIVVEQHFHCCNFFVKQRAKTWSARPADYQMQERLRQEAARTKVQEFAKEQQSCGIKNSWLKTTESHFQRQDIERQIQKCLKKQRSQAEERRTRSEVHLYAFTLLRYFLF